MDRLSTVRIHDAVDEPLLLGEFVVAGADAIRHIERAARCAPRAGDGQVVAVEIDVDRAAPGLVPVSAATVIDFIRQTVGARA